MFGLTGALLTGKNRLHVAHGTQLEPGAETLLGVSKATGLFSSIAPLIRGDKAKMVTSNRTKDFLPGMAESGQAGWHAIV